MKRTGFKKKTYEEVIFGKQQQLKKRHEFKQRSTKRAKQERAYISDLPSFLEDHPICPVTGSTTTQLHHSARRVGAWLNLKRYWIAVSLDGHRWIEDNGKEAEKLGLMVRINETFKEHTAKLLADGVDLDVPIYYQNNLVNESSKTQQ